ncbi:MAG: hypothetical protein H0U74_01165 [Bradymonadaceae bacterium]|nr:hypothetical protein [Lujinxingiaceae bacterium]
MQRRLFLPALLFCAVGLAGLHGPAHAAEFTDLLDAADDLDDFDDETYKAFDFSIEPRFRFNTGGATITREAPCVPPDDLSLQDSLVANNPRLIQEPGRCSEATIVFNKEMLYEETQSTIDVTLRAGLYKDLEIRLTVPYVLSATRGLQYANDNSQKSVDATNSSVDPSSARIQNDAQAVFSPSDTQQQALNKLDQFNTYRYFELTDEMNRIERTGFADPSIGIHWAPFNDERDDTKATLLFGMDYVMPIVPIARPDNRAVGRGVHELQWKLAASKRFNWIEPYFGLQYFLPFVATDSLLRPVDDRDNVGQVIKSPPQRGLITVGTEFVPHIDARTGARYAIDLRFQYGYTSEGRDYTPLFDHMSSSDCNGLTIEEVLPQFDTAGNLNNADAVACSWVIREAANAFPTPIYDLATAAAAGSASPFSTDGIMTVESYGTFSGQLAFNLQPSRYFQLRLAGGITHKQQHFLTNSRTGRNSDRTADDTVALTGPEARFERNPVYNPTYDSPGNRFRVEQYNVWHVAVTTALQF